MNQYYKNKLKNTKARLNFEKDSNVNPEDFSIHTFCIGWKLDSTYELNNLYKIFEEYLNVKGIDKQKYFECHKAKDKKTVVHTNVYKFLSDKYGINRISLMNKNEKNKFCYNCLSIVINPGKLMNVPYPHIRLITEEDIPRIAECFDEVMNLEFPDFGYKFKDGYMRRIDGTATIRFSNTEIALKYIKILKQLRIPPKLKYVPETIKIGENRILLKGKSQELDIYYKYEETLGHPEHFSKEEIEFSKECVRFELRFKRKNLFYRYKNVSEVGDTERDFLEEFSTIVCYEMVNKLKYCYGSGDFYNLEKVKSKISSSNYKNKVKVRMIMLVELTHRYRSLNSAIEELKEVESISKIEKDLERFNELKVSPITIDYCGKISNPIKMIQKKNVRKSKMKEGYIYN